jgi:hypothetical protein
MKPGTQIIFVPSYAPDGINHPDAEYGFVVSESGDSHFCRYWLRSAWGTLRTTANSERTLSRSLVMNISGPQSVVDDALSRILREEEAKAAREAKSEVQSSENAKMSTEPNTPGRAVPPSAERSDTPAEGPRRVCSTCKTELVWTDCDRCDGTGEIEDDDPINGPEWMRCPDCFGVGEYRVCPNCVEEL